MKDFATVAGAIRLLRGDDCFQPFYAARTRSFGEVGSMSDLPQKRTGGAI